MVIGIIGGVGAGKSTVLQLLKEQYGFRLIMSDDVAKQRMNEDETLKAALRRAFGDGIFTKEGRIDKAAYAALIYSDKEARKTSDEIVHPACWAYLEQETKSARGKDCPERIAIETALPYHDLHTICDAVWYVFADEKTRIGRLSASRGYSEEKSRAIIKSQFSDEQFRQIADAVIDNSGSGQETASEAALLLKEYGIKMKE